MNSIRKIFNLRKRNLTLKLLLGSFVAFCLLLSVYEIRKFISLGIISKSFDEIEGLNYSHNIGEFDQKKTIITEYGPDIYQKNIGLFKTELMKHQIPNYAELKLGGFIDGKEDANIWSTEIRGEYSVIKNYVMSDFEPDYERNVTLTTQGTFEYLYHIVSLCSRWDSHISVAVYSPGNDLEKVVNIIHYLRQCKKSCVRSHTSWHLIYDTAFPPNSFFLETDFKNITFNCSQTFNNIIEKFSTSFRIDLALLYPINVARNVARLSAKTRYVFASDIELYPSDGIVPAFFELKERENAGLIPEILKSNPHVYVLPIFEVEKGIDPPSNKSELMSLFKSGKAIFFHKDICDRCHSFPDRDEWVKLDQINNTLGVFRVTTRQKPRNRWEPFYIGTNSEPLWDERLTWNGQVNKMSQLYEMCLMNYDLVILNNAFLVHSPGIKYKDVEKDKKRLPFKKRNRFIYNKIIAEFEKIYGTKNNC